MTQSEIVTKESIKSVINSLKKDLNQIELAISNYSVLISQNTKKLQKLQKSLERRYSMKKQNKFNNLNSKNISLLEMNNHAKQAASSLYIEIQKLEEKLIYFQN